LEIKDHNEDNSKMEDVNDSNSPSLRGINVNITE